ncbi:NGCA protein, partial [Podilymbus podiceps]|nr:NGCA protein [Podilymbus podiceps]
GWGGLGAPQPPPAGWRRPPPPCRYSLTGDTLTVAGVDYADQGTFSCRAWTLLDSVEAEAQLRVVGRPGPVRELQVLEVGERQVRLTWTPGDEHNSPVE